MQIAHAKRTEAPEYTVDIIAQILQLIEQKQRLSNCALVSRTWHQAANLATTKVSVSYDLVTSEAYSSLSAWLSSNSNTTPLETIAVYNNRHQYRIPMAQIPILRLPAKSLSKLHDLKLLGCHLQVADEETVPAAGLLTTSEAVSASCAALTALTRLELDDCVLNNSVLGSCTSLQRLSLINYRHAAAIAISQSAEAAAASTAEGSMSDMFATALSQLRQLTHLTLKPGLYHDSRLNSPAACEVFGNLNQLLELRLQGRSISSNSSLTFPGSLTLLDMYDMSKLTVNTTPALQQLSNLQHLVLKCVEQFDPVLLQKLSKLQHLKIVYSPLDSTETQKLMSALVQLQQLQHLDLHGSLKDDLETTESYAALTASSQLTFLDIDDSAIAPAAAGYIFAADRPCKGLLKITACAELFTAPGSFERLAGCCPALEHLELLNSYAGPLEIDLQGLTALKALTALTSLALTDSCVNSEALATIASFSQLKDLALLINAAVEEGQLVGRTAKLLETLQLTQLTALTELCLICGGPEEIEYTSSFHNKSPEGSPPDVYMQLREYLTDLAVDVPVADISLR